MSNKKVFNLFNFKKKSVLMNILQFRKLKNKSPFPFFTIQYKLYLFFYKLLCKNFGICFYSKNIFSRR